MKRARISRNHGNRGPHNWLVYDVIDRLLESVSCLCRGTIYDLGAGEEPYKEFFLQHGDKYVSVDWPGSYHRVAPDIIANLNCPLPVVSDAADTVVSISVMEHLAEPQTFVNEAFRILKPGGSFILQVPWQWRIHEAPYDYFRYSPFALRYMLEKGGFRDVSVQPQAGFFATMALKFNYFSRRLIRGPWIVRVPMQAVLTVIWYLTQSLAPLLDRLDKDWSAESPGYFVTAKKL